MMALEGHGIVFLPESAVTRELRQKQLARADGGQSSWEVEMEIRLYRERPSAQRPAKPLVGRLWDYLAARKEIHTRKLKTRKGATTEVTPSPQAAAE